MSESNESIQIVLGADNNFAMPLGVAIYSILDNVNKDTNLHFHIMDGGIEKKNKKKIEELLQLQPEYDRHIISWIEPDVSLVEDLPLHSWMSRATYLRLFIPEFLPLHLEKVIYLDCDLILETDIQKLWEHEIDETVIWAARDILIQKLSHSTGVKNYENYGGNADSPYFNSGVMVINLNLWRKEKISRKSIDYLNENEERITLHEQEALNAALIGKWRELDPRWNQQGSVFFSFVLPESEFTNRIRKMYSDLVNEPYIIHYVSKSKPWDFKCMHPSNNRFLLYLKESRWFSRIEWTTWWYMFYAKRFFWLFRDLKKTLRQVKI